MRWFAEPGKLKGHLCRFGVSAGHYLFYSLISISTMEEHLQNTMEEKMNKILGEITKESTKEMIQEPTIEYLQWKVSMMQQEYKKARLAWTQESVKQAHTGDLLRRKIADLQAEVQTAKEKNKELQARVKIAEAEGQRNIKIITDLRKNLEFSNKRCEKVSLELSTCQESSRKNVMELKQEHEDLKTRMQVELDNMKEAAQKQQKHGEDLNRLVQIQKKEYLSLEERHTQAVRIFEENLESAEADNRALTTMVREMKYSFKAKDQVKQNIFEKQLAQKDDEIRALQNLKKLTSTVSQLKAAVEEKCKVTRGKDLEIAALKQEMDAIVERLRNERQKVALLEFQIKGATKNIGHLEAELQQEKSKNTDTCESLGQTLCKNKVLAEELGNLRERLKVGETENKKLNVMIHELQSYQKQFKVDLHTCMSVITEPKRLKMKVMSLHRSYIKDESQVQIDENTEKIYKCRIEFLRKKLSEHEMIAQANAERMKKMERELAATKNTSSQKEVRYIQSLNNEIAKGQQLEKQLKERTLQRKKSPESGPQRI